LSWWVLALLFLQQRHFQFACPCSTGTHRTGLIINYKTIINYFRFILGLLHRNPLGGIIAIILSVVGFPILSGVLFGKSILDRKVKPLQQAHEANEKGEEVDYEE
jgi:hypothetical protein